MTHNFILRLCYTDVYNVTIDAKAQLSFSGSLSCMLIFRPLSIMCTLKRVECVDHIPL